MPTMLQGGISTVCQRLQAPALQPTPNLGTQVWGRTDSGSWLLATDYWPLASRYQARNFRGLGFRGWFLFSQADSNTSAEVDVAAVG